MIGVETQRKTTGVRDEQGVKKRERRDESENQERKVERRPFSAGRERRRLGKGYRHLLLGGDRKI